MLLILQKRNGAHCQFTFPILSSEILQITSWATSFILLYTTQNKKCINFFLSLAHATLDADFVITSNKHLGLADYVDILSLITSAYLLVIAIRGKIGIIFDMSDSTTEPLLNGKREKHSEAKRDRLYGKASLLQLITFSWLNPLLEVEVKKSIDCDEVRDVEFKDSANFLSDSFDESLKYVKERDGTRNPYIYKAIYLFGRKKAAINAIFAVISARSSYVGPYLIDDFVNFLNKMKFQGLQSGYFLALDFIGAKMSNSPNCSVSRHLISSIAFLPWHSTSLVSITLGDLSPLRGIARRCADSSFLSLTWLLPLGLAHWNFRRNIVFLCAFIDFWHTPAHIFSSKNDNVSENNYKSYSETYTDLIEKDKNIEINVGNLNEKPSTSNLRTRMDITPTYYIYEKENRDKALWDKRLNKNWIPRQTADQNNFLDLDCKNYGGYGYFEEEEEENLERKRV
ncbi:hypothetical protein R3W88_033520 [Solanum pinnatisectum]|uniref:Uncharacterized protein n=1 Tax=Solanum pinnatisectum TaxID=50273 RepID=A0AAV9K0S2_9SOLN|nr:hypothetical protein R3W88_033520 [Solanum pinnatisectum]